MKSTEPDTYRLTELDDRSAVFAGRGGGAGNERPRQITLTLKQWHEWDRPVDLVAVIEPVADTDRDETAALHREFDSADRSARGDGGWSTRIVDTGQHLTPDGPE